MSIGVVVVCERALERRRLIVALEVSQDVSVRGEAGTLESAVEAAAAWRPEVVLVSGAVGAASPAEVVAAVGGASPDAVVVALVYPEAEAGEVGRALRAGAVGIGDRRNGRLEALALVERVAAGEVVIPGWMVR